MAKLYLFGKLLDPELKETTTHQTFLRFCVYSNHESVQFDVYEKQSQKINGVETLVDNPLFARISEIKDASPVMALLRPVYSDRYHTLRYYLDDIYTVEPAAQKAINSVLSRKPLSEVKS